MKTSRILALIVSSILGIWCRPAFGQDRVFNWVAANDETVRLDPANYHTGHTFHPGPNGGKNQVDIKAERPVTIFMVPADQWSAALQHPETIVQVQPVCVEEHVVETRYVCDLPPQLLTLVVRDERNSLDPAVFAGMGAVLNRNDKTDRAIEEGMAAVLTGQGSVTRRFVSPNDVHVQYYSWNCVENCIQPEITWIREVKEKYELSAFLKIYGGFAPDHDGEPVSIKIKSPVPMLVAMLPSPVANQLHARPEMLEPALEKSACQQRGVQKLEFECKFDLSDGPQSLVVVPEQAERVPKKKAEIEMLAAKCVANCELLASKK